MRPEHITLLDNFAAHAPAEPLWDFPVRGYEKRPEVIFDDLWMRRRADSPTNERELQDFDADRKKARRIQWPYVWAQAMLDERLNHL